jgi:hypothetical protein
MLMGGSIKWLVVLGVVAMEEIVGVDEETAKEGRR